MHLKKRAIEKGRIIPRGAVAKDVDLPWEAYLQVHAQAEALGLLAHDPELHRFLDARLEQFEHSSRTNEVTA